MMMEFLYHLKKSWLLLRFRYLIHLEQANFEIETQFSVKSTPKKSHYRKAKIASHL